MAVDGLVMISAIVRTSNRTLPMFNEYTDGLDELRTPMGAVMTPSEDYHTQGDMVNILFLPQI